MRLALALALALALTLTVRRYGGLSAQAFAVEAALYVARYGKGMTDEEHAALAWLQSAAAEGLEWHRNKQLKHAVLCALAELIYHHSGWR